MRTARLALWQSVLLLRPARLVGGHPSAPDISGAAATLAGHAAGTANVPLETVNQVSPIM